MRAPTASLLRPLILAAVLALGLSAAPVGAYAKPEATGARAGLQDGGLSRFVLDLSEQIDARVLTQTGPNRIVVETPTLDWRSGNLAKAVGPFRTVRFMQQGGIGKILIDLSEPVAVKNAFLIPPRQGFGWRMVIDVGPASVAAVREARPVEIGQPRFEQAAPAPKPAPAPQQASLPVAPVAQPQPAPARLPVMVQVPAPVQVAEARPAVQSSSFVITSPALASPPSQVATAAPAPVSPPMPVSVPDEPRTSLSPVSSARAATVAPPTAERITEGVRSVSMPLPPAVRMERAGPESRPAPIAVASAASSPALPLPAPPLAVPAVSKSPEPPKAAEKGPEQKSEPKAVTQLASLPMQPAPEPKRQEARKAPKKDDVRVIVIDPGHGGVDPGALSISGVYEKKITLDVALAVKAEMERKGGFRVVLTRDRDVFIPLRDRVKKAREVGADLFLSLHADSVANPGIRGLSVYTLSENASDAEAQALADKENKVDLIAGLDLSHESPEVTNILIDLTQRETMNRSASFAQSAVGELAGVTTLLGNTHRFAGFAVLKAPDVPSVLIELGYLSNKDEEPLLRQPAYRAKLAAALSRSIERYFAVPAKGKRS